MGTRDAEAADTLGPTTDEVRIRACPLIPVCANGLTRVRARAESAVRREPADVHVVHPRRRIRTCATHAGRFDGPADRRLGRRRTPRCRRATSSTCTSASRRGRSQELAGLGRVAAPQRDRPGPHRPRPGQPAPRRPGAVPPPRRGARRCRRPPAHPDDDGGGATSPPASGVVRTSWPTRTSSRSSAWRRAAVGRRRGVYVHAATVRPNLDVELIEAMADRAGELGGVRVHVRDGVRATGTLRAARGPGGAAPASSSSVADRLTDEQLWAPAGAAPRPSCCRTAGAPTPGCSRRHTTSARRCSHRPSVPTPRRAPPPCGLPR